jgi:hypothetical protein
LNPPELVVTLTDHRMVIHALVVQRYGRGTIPVGEPTVELDRGEDRLVVLEGVWRACGGRVVGCGGMHGEEAEVAD